MRGGDIPAFMTSDEGDELSKLVAVRTSGRCGARLGRRTSASWTGDKIDPVVNHEALDARNDIDAVLIATADFQHAQHGIDAVKGGASAYVEKPTATR